MEGPPGLTAANRRPGIQTEEDDVQVRLLPDAEEPWDVHAHHESSSSSSGDEHLDSDSVEEEAAEEAAAIPMREHAQNLIAVIGGGTAGAGVGIGIGYAALHTAAGMGAGTFIGVAGGVVVSAMALKAVRACASNQCNVL